MNIFLRIILFFMVFCTSITYADNGVNLILTKGADKAIPIAVVPFSGQVDNPSASDNLTGVISADLSFSGLFKVLPSTTYPAAPHDSAGVTQTLWRKAGVEDVVVGQVQMNGAHAHVSFALVDVVKSGQAQVLVKQTYDIPAIQLRALAHHIADVIYFQLTGVKGIFSTRIAYVQKNKTFPPTYALEVADADGFNPRPILVSNEPIMSPAWSPDGKRIAYVSFEGKRAQIYIATVASGERRVVSAAPGINGAPAWSPDGRQLALVLSKSGTPKIYLLTLATGQLQQLTSGPSIDTEPAFAPNGQSIIFTSDRGGSPQIYRLNLANKSIERLTFTGDYNARASFSKDGKLITMIQRKNGQYNIAIQNLNSSVVLQLTNSGRDDSPTLAPNGMMVLYGNEYGELGLVTTDGRVKLRVPGKNGLVQDPAWSPFLN